MADFTKLARWALPGAVAVAWLLGSLQLQRLFAATAFSLRPVISSGVGLAVATVASVPLGFLIYQFYSNRFNNRVRGLDVVHKDVARRALESAGLTADLNSGYEDRRIDGVRWRRNILLSRHNWSRTYWLWHIATKSWFVPTDREQRRVVLNSYYRQRERNWIEVEWSLTRKEPLTGYDLSRTFAEVDRLSEIYHTLGAVRAGAVLATGLSAVIGLAIAILGGRTASWPGFLLGEFVTCGLTVLVYFFLQENRAHTLDRRSAVMSKLLQALQP